MLLGLMNHINRAHAQVRKGEWLREPNRGVELGGKTVGIIGYGNTGNAFAKRLAGFNVRILAHDKYKSGFGTGMIEETRLNAIYEQADVVSLHVQLTPETQYLVNKSFIQRFSKPFYLVNTSRGKVVCTEVLIWALDDGLIIGAALDVPPTNLSFHLKALAHAQLVSVVQEGRYQRYRANLSPMRELIAYLTAECCDGMPERCEETRGAACGEGLGC